MTDTTLVVLLAGQEIGQVRRDRRNRLTFAYGEEWRAFRGAFPLSLSMPLAAREHHHEKIEPFLWGLLPDNEQVLGRWGRRFQVSARNAFSLMSHVGEDCAGAVQFVRPERLDAILAPGASEVEWLDEAGVAERLRALREDHAAWRMPRDTGQFSLAGAQPKTALLRLDGRWGLPSGRTPTTHILKPPSGEFDGHAENEHFCLMLAREIGLPAAKSEIGRFDGEIAIVVERFDRVRVPNDATTTNSILRVHQEDVCQALGLPPTAKYQNDGGPGPKTVVELLENYSSLPKDDVRTFVDALAFNWLIGGTDAHAKNYALFHGGGGRVRLAPLYDVASALPYPDLDPLRIKSAMKIGDEYRLRDIGPRQWLKFAKELRLDPDRTLARVRSLASDLPAGVARVRAGIERDGVKHPIVGRLSEALTRRAEQCVKALKP